MKLQLLPKHYRVASFTDAWIETIGANKRQKRAMSHLLQMRGLKLAIKNKRIIASVSHLLQMRGLKRNSHNPHPLLLGRIFYRCVD